MHLKTPMISEENTKNNDYLELAKISMQKVYIQDNELESPSYKLYVEKKL